MHYGDGRHFVSGDRGLRNGRSPARLSTESDSRCVADLADFEGDKVLRKDSFWKIVER